MADVPAEMTLYEVWEKGEYLLLVTSDASEAENVSQFADELRRLIWTRGEQVS